MNSEEKLDFSNNYPGYFAEKIVNIVKTTNNKFTLISSHSTSVQICKHFLVQLFFRSDDANICNI